MKSLVICPLKIELNSLVKALQQKGLEFKASETKLGIVQNNGEVYFAVGGLGSAKFAEKAKRLLEIFPDVNKVFCVGTAGALRSHLNVGDLIIPKSVSDYETQITALSSTIQIHRGEILCLEQPLLDDTEKLKVVASTQALAVSMEAVAANSFLESRGFLEIRAVSDYANSEAQNHFSQNLDQAMKAAAELVFELLFKQKV